MRTTRRATPIVIATALALGVAGLTGCGTPSSPSATKLTTAAKATTPATPAPSATPTTKATEPGSVAMAGYQPADVASAARFAETFARAAMSGCGTTSLASLQYLMTPALYKAALKNPQSWMILTLNPPMVMSTGCVTSQKLTDGHISPGAPTKGMASVRVAVTLTEGLLVGTTTSPKALKPITVSRRFTVDVLPYGKDWLAQTVVTGNLTLVTTGK